MLSIVDQFEADVEYVSRRSFRLDIEILARPSGSSPAPRGPVLTPTPDLPCRPLDPGRDFQLVAVRARPSGPRRRGSSDHTASRVLVADNASTDGSAAAGARRVPDRDRCRDGFELPASPGRSTGCSHGAGRYDPAQRRRLRRSGVTRRVIDFLDGSPAWESFVSGLERRRH